MYAGKPIHIQDGFQYILKKKGLTKEYWCCRKFGCHATLRIDSGNVEGMGEHNHAPSEANITEEKFLARMKQRASLETTSVPQIYEEESRRLAEEGITIRI